MTEAVVRMKSRYAALCKKRDEVNSATQPLKDTIAKLNAEIIERQDKVAEKVRELNQIRGGQTWLDLKKEIGLLAKALSGV